MSTASAKHQNMSKADLRKFGLLTAALLVLFFDLLIPWIWDIPMPVWPLYPAGLLALLAIVAPAVIGPFYRVWMRFAEALGWVNTRIILGLVFYLVLLPFGLVIRSFKDPMQRKFDPTVDSYRVESSQPKTDNLERPY